MTRLWNISGQVLIWLLFFVAACAYGQEREGRHGVGHDKWHEGFYGKLVRPSDKRWCCNLADCTPTISRQNRITGRYEVKANGEWVAVPSDRIIPISAPDGGAHVCYTKPPAGHLVAPEKLHCVVLEPES